MSIRRSLSAVLSSAGLMWPSLFTSLFLSLVLYVPCPYQEPHSCSLGDLEVSPIGRFGWIRCETVR